MRFLLIRHGDTFGPGDRVVWVGANEDLPLVESGRRQARDMGRALTAKGLAPARFIAGPLQRTQGHARIIMREMGLSDHPETDERLREIDYGPWGGLNEADIAERHGAEAIAELEAWDGESRWPANAGWKPGEDAIRANALSLLEEVQASGTDDDLVCLVSSNGVLRYFLDAMPGGLEARVRAGNFRMKTGAASLFSIKEGERALLFWNRRAAGLPD